MPVIMESLSLKLASRFDPGLNYRRCLTEAIVTQLFVIHAWHFNVNIDPVQQGTGDAFLVAGDC